MENNNNNLQVRAIFKIPEGKLEEFTRKVDEIMKYIRDKGTKALMYDVFINSDQTVCEVREEYKNSEDLIEHMIKFREFLQTNFFRNSTKNKLNRMGFSLGIGYHRLII